MVDKNLLDLLISKSGKKKGYLAQKLNLSRTSFHSKCSNKTDFTVAEASILSDELNITDANEKVAIFFKPNVEV